MASTGHLSFSEIIPTNKTHKNKNPNQNNKKLHNPQSPPKQMSSPHHPVKPQQNPPTVKTKRNKKEVEMVVLGCAGSNFQIQRILEKLLLQMWSNGAV